DAPSRHLSSWAIAASRPTIVGRVLVPLDLDGPSTVASRTGATNWYPRLGKVSMKAGWSDRSPKALRISRMYFLTTSGLTWVSGQSASRISPCVTRRSLCSTRYRSRSNAFGVTETRSWPRQSRWFTVSSRNERNSFIGVREHRGRRPDSRGTPAGAGILPRGEGDVTRTGPKEVPGGHAWIPAAA